MSECWHRPIAQDHSHGVAVMAGGMRMGRGFRSFPVLRWLLGGPQVNQLVRMAPVLALVDEVSGSDLLDAGSGSRGVGRWLRGWRVTSVDNSFDDYGGASGPRRGLPRPVLGDVRALPFEDGEFDVVLAVDLIQHVPPQDRAGALAELARVTRGRLVVTCPTGQLALECDRRLAQKAPSPPPWLGEHLTNGFPTRKDLVVALSAHGHVGSLDSDNIVSHERLVLAELRPLSALALRVVAAALSAALQTKGPLRHAAERILRGFRGWDRSPAYRSVIVLDRSGERPY